MCIMCLVSLKENEPNRAQCCVVSVTQRSTAAILACLNMCVRVWCVPIPTDLSHESNLMQAQHLLLFEAILLAAESTLLPAASPVATSKPVLKRKRRTINMGFHLWMKYQEKRDYRVMMSSILKSLFWPQNTHPSLILIDKITAHRRSGFEL